MPDTAVAPARSQRRPARAVRLTPVGSWSRRRQAVSIAAVLAVLAAAGVFVWRATMAPLHLYTGSSSCSTLPKRDVGQLYGIANSRDLTGATAIRISSIRSTAWGGKTAPRYWLVPVDAGSGGTGSADVTDPPPHWAERQPAVGAVFASNRPMDLVVELSPQRGHAALLGVTIDYRTPDGLPHTAAGNPSLEVDTTGNCINTTGRF